MAEFKIPELGENIDSGTLTKILVSEGERIEQEQPVIELETEKAAVEVPSDVSGRVEKILAKEGDEVKVGQAIFTVSDVEAGKETAAAEKEVKEEPEEKKEVQTKKKDADEIEGEKPLKTGEPRKKAGRKTGEVVEFKLPELGENVEVGTITSVLVSEGDTVEKEQNVVEMETEKAALEVPCDVSGVVKEIPVKEGDEVKVGQALLKIEIREGGEVEEEAAPGEAAGDVGASRQPEEEPEEKETVVEPEKAEHVESPAAQRAAVEKAARKPGGQPVPAAPSVRRFAREIGIEINEVPGTGPAGRISVDDVKKYSKMFHKRVEESRGMFRGLEPEALPDFSKWGDVERQPMSNVRRKTAKHLGYAWATVAHVTQHDKADITELENFRKKFSKRVEKAGGKLTVTAILLKVIASALKVFPKFNASIDLENNEIIFKKYYHIGIAVDTERGLLVPVIRNVDQKNLVKLSVELSEVASKARDKKLTIEDMQGGNFSISNLGGIGGTSFTPVVNSPEAAILGVSRSQFEPVFKDGNFEPRLMLPLSLSYDHRLIDGADAARFLRWVAEALEQPYLLMLEG